MELEVTKATSAGGQVWSGSQVKRCGTAREPGVTRGPQDSPLGCLPQLLPGHSLVAAGIKIREEKGDPDTCSH